MIFILIVLTDPVKSFTVWGGQPPPPPPPPRFVLTVSMDKRRQEELHKVPNNILGNLSKDVFERRTSTGSKVFSLLICLDANKFVLLSFSSLIKTIYPRFSTEPLPNDAKSPLPVDVRRSKTLLLKLPNKKLK